VEGHEIDLLPQIGVAGHNRRNKWVEVGLNHLVEVQIIGSDEQVGHDQLGRWPIRHDARNQVVQPVGCLGNIVILGKVVGADEQKNDVWIRIGIRQS